MTYKHGDWYCKPANEAEAKEIVERAVASGAALYDSVGESLSCEYKWNQFRSWGVITGTTCTGNSDVGGSFQYATEYNMQQVREKFLLPGKRVEPAQESSGEGLPPVGTVCEAIYDEVWHRCEILKHKVNNSGMKVAACDFGFKLAWSAEFRPLRSERERWVDDCYKNAQIADCVNFTKGMAGAIYDALKSGDLKAPEVE